MVENVTWIKRFEDAIRMKQNEIRLKEARGFEDLLIDKAELDGLRSMLDELRKKESICKRTLHHNGGVFPCIRLGPHEGSHLFELRDVDTRLEEDTNEDRY